MSLDDKRYEWNCYGVRNFVVNKVHSEAWTSDWKVIIIYEWKTAAYKIGKLSYNEVEDNGCCNIKKSR